MSAAPVFAIGDVAVHRLVDIERFAIPFGHIFPTGDLAALAPHRAWLDPGHVDFASGDALLAMQGFLLRVDGLAILIDTCVGNDKDRGLPPWHQRRDHRFLADLAALGLAPADVDIVLCTHLHADHVGWNTRLENGRWVPTFPNARYAFAAQELAFWEAQETSSHGSYDDSVLPVIAAGLDWRVEPGWELAKGLRVESLPGHTPHHVGVAVARGDGRALFCGDAMHSVAQLPTPRWSAAFCDDPLASAATRVRMLDQAADEGTLLVPAHIRAPHAFRVRREGEAFRPAFVRA